MPVSIVIGGQFGSEGKGKVCQILAGEMEATAVVRVGGPNSGHTGIDQAGDLRILRQLPTASMLPRVHIAICPGSYINPELLQEELAATRLDRERLSIDPKAVVIEESDRENELISNLQDRVGSTQSGTGAAVVRRARRVSEITFAENHPILRSFVRPVVPILRKMLGQGQRIIIEGTQGFGLSVLHSCNYPYVTSRDTTAAGFLAETGLSPLDVDDVVMVLRAFPIRVGGNSGPLPNEIDWLTVTEESQSPEPLIELTSATRRIRRIARFDVEVVTQAIAVNKPTRIVMNHLDYVDNASHLLLDPTQRIDSFIEKVENQVGRTIDFYGFSPSMLYRASDGAICSCETAAGAMR